MANATKIKQPTFSVVKLKRAVSAARKIGFDVGSIEIGPSGSIKLIKEMSKSEPTDSLDKWVQRRARAS